LQASQNPLCAALFNSSDPSALLQQLAAGGPLGSITEADLGGTYGNGSLDPAQTKGILGSTTVQGDNGQTITQSTWTGANITINSNAPAPFSSDWSGIGALSGYSGATLNAATILHELGHAANLIYGSGSSVILDDDKSISGSSMISNLNTTFILNNCFGAP